MQLPCRMIQMTNYLSKSFRLQKNLQNFKGVSHACKEKGIFSLLQNFRNHGSPLSRKYDASLKLMLISGRDGFSRDSAVIKMLHPAPVMPALEWNSSLLCLSLNSFKLFQNPFLCSEQSFYSYRLFRHLINLQSLSIFLNILTFRNVSQLQTNEEKVLLKVQGLKYEIRVYVIFLRIGKIVGAIYTHYLVEVHELNG